MSYPGVPIWEKYTLTIEEAAKYFRIREKSFSIQSISNYKCSLYLMNSRFITVTQIPYSCSAAATGS